MEEKRRDTASSPAAPSSAEMDSASTRRRAGALKRKANSQSVSNSSPAPSKRITRDKSSLILQPQVNHYGPLTRARHGAPSFLDSASPLGSTVTKPDELVLVKDISKNDRSEDLNASEEWEALEAKIETEFEGIRSRDTNAHVVPNHCGWFSWTRIHPLEERMLPSFFNGKTATRNPDLFLEIRNWIMKKFHATPNVQIEQKDLLELEVGDLDARVEVVEFLDYWGLINFHPFPPVDLATANGDKKKDSLLEKLFHFETMESGPPTLRQCHLASPVPSSRFVPESALAEELGKAEGPSVEYHCNSCSGDCSRKRFHCQKQADFDLCTECFNNGKFGSDMSSSDFILMESAEVPGVSSGKWTDQETLLLLEALELFKENWNEIAEHVATKTKAQCILHFVQMPIEDTFLDCDDEVETNSKETIDSAVATDEATAPEDTPQPLESKTNPDDSQVQASTTNTSKTKDVSEVQVSQETSHCANEVEVKASPETSKLGDVNELKATSDNNENVALKALREAFEAIGYQLTPESTLSFADVGNPVMALAGFLTKLVEPDIATATARNSLKSMSGNSPGLLLAAKHCFVLEDPPTDGKEPASESVIDENADQDVQKEDMREDKSEKEDKSNPDLDGGNSSGIDRNHDTEACVSKVSSVDDQPMEKKEPSIVAGDNVVKSSDMNDSNGSESQKDHQLHVMNTSDDPESQVLPSSGKDPEGADRSVAETCQPAEDIKDKDMLDSLPSGTGDPCKPAASKLDGEPTETAEALDKSTDTHQQEQQLNSNSTSALSQPAAAPKDEEMLDDSLPSERMAPNSDSLPSAGVTQTEEVKADSCDSEETTDECDINKLKRAAVSALSAAAMKAKLLADQEEEQIRQLATFLIEKQLHKLETKLAFFNEMESVVMRVKEQLERLKQKLYHERAQIIAARLGLPASSSRPVMSSSTPANRIAANFANAFPRPPMAMSMSAPRPMGTVAMAPMPSNPLGSGSSIRNANQDGPSSGIEGLEK